MSPVRVAAMVSVFVWTAPLCREWVTEPHCLQKGRSREHGRDLPGAQGELAAGPARRAFLRAPSRQVQPEEEMVVKKNLPVPVIARASGKSSREGIKIFF